MITKKGYVYKLICDICGEDSGENFDNFDEAVEYKKEAGWRSVKEDGEWIEMCPDCKEEY